MWDIDKIKMIVTEEEYNKMLREFWTVRKIIEYTEKKIKEQENEVKNT